MGVQTMLAHYHYGNRGQHPFVNATRHDKLWQIAEEAGLSSEQADLVRRTALWAANRSKALR